MVPRHYSHQHHHRAQVHHGKDDKGVDARLAESRRRCAIRPVVMATISTPPNVYSAKPRASNDATAAVGKKSAMRRVLRGHAGRSATTSRQSAMNASMVASFTIENQYSNRPYSCTLRKFTSPRNSENSATQTAVELAGNQYRIYVAEATRLAPTERQIAAQ